MAGTRYFEVEVVGDVPTGVCQYCIVAPISPDGTRGIAKCMGDEGHLVNESTAVELTLAEAQAMGATFVDTNSPLAGGG